MNPRLTQQQRTANAQRLQELLTLLYSHPTREQQERAAAALGCIDVLPDVQDELPLKESI